MLWAVSRSGYLAAEKPRTSTKRLVLEGLPGAGKTTLAAKLSRALGGPVVPEWVGLEDRDWARWPLTLPFYFANDELKEAVARFVAAPWVILDRHYASTLAFAYALDGEGQESPRADESWAGNLAWFLEARSAGRLSPPDVVVWLDIDPALSLARQPRARAFDPVWGEAERLSAMRRGYAHIFERYETGIRIVKVDTSRPEEAVLDEVLEALR